MKTLLLLLTITLTLGVASAQLPPGPNYTQTILQTHDSGGTTDIQWLVYGSGIGVTGNGWELWLEEKTDRNLHNCCDESYLVDIGYWSPEYDTQLNPTNAIPVGCEYDFNHYYFLGNGWYGLTDTMCNSLTQVSYEINNGYGVSSPNKSDAQSAFSIWGKGH